jgi:SAM-dependent methyltransferase
MSRPPSDPYGLGLSRPEDYDALRLEVIRNRWDQKADRWDADLADEHFHLNEDDAYHRFLDAADSVVAERAEFCRRQCLVDLACGTGLVLAHFLDRFAGGVGVDISPKMLALAARRRLPHTQLVEASCFELAKHVAGAGAVLSRGILLSHYGPRWMPLLLEQVCQSLSSEGGFAILDFLNAATRCQYACHPENKTYFHPQQIEAAARRAGFRRVRILGEPQRRVLAALLER